jgi:hypothetical protein
MRRLAWALTFITGLVAGGIGVIKWQVAQPYGSWCVPGCQLESAALTAPASAPEWCGFWTDGTNICRRASTGAIACQHGTGLSTGEERDFHSYAKTHTWQITSNVQMYEQMVRIRTRALAKIGAVEPDQPFPGVEISPNFAGSPALVCEAQDVGNPVRRCHAVFGAQKSSHPYCLRLVTTTTPSKALSCQPGCMIPVDHNRSILQGWLLLISATLHPLTTTVKGWFPTSKAGRLLDLSQCSNWLHHCNGCSANGSGASCTLLGCGNKNSHDLCKRLTTEP